MKLGEIRNYVKQRGDSSLVDIANHFDISQEAAKFAVDYWIKKGKIKIQGAVCGSSCGGCGSASNNYQWVHDKQPVHAKVSN